MRKGAPAAFSVIFLFIISVFPAAASYNRYGIPDSSEIRSSLIETWFEAPLSSVRMNRPEIRTNRIGEKFQIRLEESEDTFNIFVSPHASIEVDVYSDKTKETVKQDIYPGDAPGSWVLVRDKKNGRPIRIRFYFARDSEIFVQFSPENNLAYADFLVYGCYASRGAPSGLPFSRFYTASFSDIVKWTENILPWQYTQIYTDDYHSSLQMIQVIREKLPQIVHADDAMYDGNGNPVYISTGKPRKIEQGEEDKISVSSAGFMKWIGDGLVEPLTGGKIKRSPLLVQTVSYKDIGFQGILSESYDISFAIDWIRNLASAIVSVRTGHTYMYDESGVDVTVEPFCARLTEKGIQNTYGYINNTGYSVQTLKPLLYVLAATEPETFYFCALRETDRRTPEVKVFNDCAAIFPYFDSEGRFQCVVFKDGAEIPFAEFYSRYCLDYIFLTRVRCSEQFFPQ